MLYTEILVRYFHFLTVFAIVASISAEYFLLRPHMKRSEIKLLSRIDAVYGLGAIGLLGAGFTLWFVLGKPPEFYTYNWVFWTKIGLFSVMGGLSVYPTIFFNKNRKGNSPDDLVEIPPLVKKLIFLELILLIFIPLCASLMARGVGSFS